MTRMCAFSLIFFLVAAPVARADRVTDIVPLNARSQGMGQTGVNASNDSYAAFINPANLASKRNKPHFEIINAQIEGSENAGNALFSGRKNPMSLGDVYPYLKSNKGEWAGYRYSIYPNFTSRFLSVGLLYDAKFAAKYDLADPNIVGDTDKVTHKGYRRVMPTASLSFRLFGGILRFGYTLGLEYLGVVNSVVTSPDTKQLSHSNGIYEGIAVRNTAGLTLTLPYAHLPSFSFVARDIGNARYHGGGLREVRKMTFDGGVSYSTYFSRWLEMMLTADYRDITNQLGTGSRMRRLFTGTEIRVGKAVSLRGGYAQGYPAAGLGFRMNRLKMDLSYYKDERGDRLRDDGDDTFALQITWSLLNQ